MKLSKWLEWAIQVEDASDVDMEVGLDSVCSKTSVELDRNQLIAFLQQNLSGILSQQELEEIAKETEENVQERIKEKVLMLAS